MTGGQVNHGELASAARHPCTVPLHAKACTSSWGHEWDHGCSSPPRAVHGAAGGGGGGGGGGGQSFSTFRFPQTQGSWVLQY
jgi:hypothetical protein